jgi:hypothetical protein
MSEMKRLLYILSISVVMFSCKKEYSYEGGPTANPTYYLTATVDGVPLKFNVDNEAAYTLSSGLNALELTGFASADPNDNTNITLDIYYDVTPPGAGTYTGQNNDYFVIGIYDFGDPNTVYTAGINNISVSPLTITITCIVNNVVTGTFSGAFYRTDVNTGIIDMNNYILITEGKFRLPLQ